MAKDYLLILRTGTAGGQRAFCTLLQQKEIAFRALWCQRGRAAGNGGDFIEHLYLMEADFCSLSLLKKTIETSVSYDALLLFEYIDW